MKQKKPLKRRKKELFNEMKYDQPLPGVELLKLDTTFGHPFRDI